jgi:magnesium-transporting ATPase (P-type)
LFRTTLVGLLLCAAGFGLYEWELTHEDSIDKARTAAVNVFIVGQAFYLLNCRSLTRSMFTLGLFSNPWVWVGIAAILLAQAAFNYLPAMNWLFHTAPTGQSEWLLAVAAGVVIYVVVGFEKFIANRVRRRVGSN